MCFHLFFSSSSGWDFLFIRFGCAYLDVVARSFTMVLYFVVDITIRIYNYTPKIKVKENKKKKKKKE